MNKTNRNGDLLVFRRSQKGRNKRELNLTWRVYGLTVITLLNVLSFAQQYVLIVTIFGMATDLEFGDTECHVINETAARDYIGDLNITGAELCAEPGRCSANSTFYLPGICGLRYTGQGTLYDILAGPIYLVIQGIAAIPLVGFVQRFYIKPHFALAVFTAFWTLCTMFIAFVKDYWAVALLRFMFGVFSGPLTPLGVGYLSHIFPMEVHTIVFGVSQAGVLVGYGISFIFILVSNSIGWRWCYVICGSAGLPLALAACFLKNPKGVESKMETLTPSLDQVRAGLKKIVWTFMMCLIISHSMRIASSYVITFNLTLYSVEYFPEFNVATFGAITIIMGVCGCVFGGWMSDRQRKVTGLQQRLGLCLTLGTLGLVFASVAFQTSLTFLVILYACVIFTSEWFYVIVLAIITDLTPLECKLVVLAICYFFTHSVAGAINLLVTPLTSLTDYRTALTILCSTLLGSAAIFILICIAYAYIRGLTLEPSSNKSARKEGRKLDFDEKSPLIYSYSGSADEETPS